LRTHEWTDIFLHQANGIDSNIGRCDGSNCSQPALSPDAALLVSVKGGG
jgi:hypothetical protein